MIPADLIIVNASLWTMNEPLARSEALAVSGNTIVQVGTTQEILERAGPRTRIIDALGGTVLPGFVESHMHLFVGAAGLSELSLEGVLGSETANRLITEYVDEQKRQDLVCVAAVDYNLFGENVSITRHDLDEILPDTPLLLRAVDYHTGWANTIALERAGITQGKELGAGHEIVLDADGIATGELREMEAFMPVLELLVSGGRENLGLKGLEPDGPLTEQQWREDIETLESGLEHCASLGITTIHNMDGNRYLLELLTRIQECDGLKCRVEVPFHLTPEKPLKELEIASELSREFDSDMLFSRRVKMFADGVIDTGTAYFVDPYCDGSGSHGEPLFTHQHFNQAAIEIDRRGLQISVHAIGDAAVRMVLDGYLAARQANGKRDSRHRIEHVSVIHPEDVPRFNEMDVIASMQPTFAFGQKQFPLEPTASMVGKARWVYCDAWRTLWDTGARIAFSSDWPVAPLAPIISIDAAVSRQKLTPGMPDQRANLYEALDSYTVQGAYACFMEDKIGRLKAGMLADIVVMSANIEEHNLEDLAMIEPILTICDGKVTFDGTRGSV